MPTVSVGMVKRDGNILYEAWPKAYFSSVGHTRSGKL